jgi:hypothetical protein
MNHCNRIRVSAVKILLYAAARIVRQYNSRDSNQILHPEYRRWITVRELQHCRPSQLEEMFCVNKKIIFKTHGPMVSASK